MKISKRLAHKLQNLIQMVLSYMELKQEDRAKKRLHEMSRLIHNHTVEEVPDCDDCPRDREEPEP